MLTNRRIATPLMQGLLFFSGVAATGNLTNQTTMTNSTTSPTSLSTELAVYIGLGGVGVLVLACIGYVCCCDKSVANPYSSSEKTRFANSGAPRERNMNFKV